MRSLRSILQHGPKQRPSVGRARPERVAVLGLAVVAACGGEASSTQLKLPDAGAQKDPATQSAAGARDEPGPGASHPALAPLSFDALFQTLLADLEAQPAERRPFIRYVSLAHQRLAGASDAELTAERAALSLALNSTSTRAELAPAAAVNDEALLYRIDLRDYGWEREIEVAGATHRDGWEAIIAGDPYAVAFSGREADELARLANTAVPIVHAEPLVRQVTRADIYHALASVPEDLYSATPPWGVNYEAALTDLALVRAANDESAHITRDEERVSQRFLSPDTGLPLWQSAGMFAGGASSIFENPFDYGDGETFAIFSLPNGLVGYATYDDGGKRRTASEGLPELENPSSCFGCHVEGPIRMLDLVRSYVERNLRQFDRETSAATLAIYPPQEQLDALVASDQAAYRSRLTLLGLPNELGADVITTTLARFERPLSLARAAVELGVTPDHLSSSLAALGPELAGLAGGVEVSRSDFSRVFAASLCTLHSDATGHHPVTEGCATP